LISAWGSPVPFWDQWDVEGALYRGWLTDTLSWHDMIAPHNEHRIALTKLADLALFIVYGGWNPWAQLLLNAVLHAGTAAIVAAMFWHALLPRPRVIFVAGLAVLFTTTAGWQNALWGFQSQVYFTNLFAVIAFFALSAVPVRTRSECSTTEFACPSALNRKDALHLVYGVVQRSAERTAFVLQTGGAARAWLAIVALFLALFSNAAGVIAAVVALGLTFPRHPTVRAWFGFCIVIAVVATGVALRVDTAHHAPLHATSAGQFFAVFARGMSWPHVNSAWAWLVMQLPLVLLIVHRARLSNGLNTSAADRCALALAAFAILQAAAVAYSRGAGLPEYRPLSRYQDPLILGSTAQLYAALRLAITAGQPGRLILLAWGAVTLAGMISLTTTNLSLNLPYKRATDMAALTQIQSYVRTARPDSFSLSTYFAGPDSDVAGVIRILDDAVLKSSLPRQFREAVPRPWIIEHAGWVVSAAVFFVIVTAIQSLARSRETIRSSISPNAILEDKRD
jgi:hypothetical protein